MKLNDYIFVSKLFDACECDEIINKTNQYKWRQHKWNASNTKHKSVEEIDDILVCNIDPLLESKLTPKLLNVFGKYSILLGPKSVPIQLINNWDSIRINKYTEGVGMRNHIDHGIDREHPVLTIIALLNDEFTGGNTFILNEEVLLKKGDCVIFPSNFMYPHEIKPVVNGTRYSLTTWAY
jgi:predicted 2-oxoglutarate/Fe(II)-dependent dioxygenase YbiX